MLELDKYERTRQKENEKVKESLKDGDVDKSDIQTMVFDIFSSRTKLVYNFGLRF